MRAKTSTWLIIGVLLAGLSEVKGQEARAVLQGRVVDPTGAVVVGAEVRSTNVNTNIVIRATTNRSGDYVLPLLIPGQYTIVVEMKGFKRFAREGITLRVNDRITADATLELGQVTETMTVTAEAQLVDTSTASMGQTFDSRTILDLPLKDGMVLMMAHLAPGVTSSPGQSGYSRPFDVDNPTRLSVGGTGSYSSEFTMDGAPNMQRGRPAYSPPPGVVDEMKVQTTTFDASAGFMVGAALNVSLKSGTNKLNGQIYHFHQNPKVNANKFLNNSAGVGKSVYRVNRWGGNASGPIILPRLYDGRDKSFWMYGYEGIRSKDPLEPTTGAVPTAQQQTGNLSGLLAIGSQYQIYDPYSTTPVAGGRFSRVPLANNIIPQNLIHPMTQTVVKLYDPPTRTGTLDGKNNYVVDGNADDRYYNHIVRIDHFRGNQRVFGRGHVTKMYRPQNVRFHEASGNIYLRWNRGLAFDHVYTFSPRFVLNSRYSYTRFIQGTDPLPAQMRWDLAGLGFSTDYINRIKQVDPRALMLPEFAISDYQGFGTTGVNRLHSDIHDAAANIMHLVRSHTLRYGFGVRPSRYNSFGLGASSGSLAFGTNWTRGPLDTSPVAPMGQGLANFLYGLPTDGSFPITASRADQSITWALYLQDDWRVSRNVTLSFGLRYELNGPVTERFNRSVLGFDPAPSSPIEGVVRGNYAKSPIPEIPLDQFRVRGGLTFAGVNGNPRALWNKDKTNFMPRFGFAYSVTPKTILRGGYGVYFAPIGIVYLNSNQTGFSRTTNLVASLDNGQTYVIKLSNPFPGDFARPLGAAGGLETNLGQSVSFFTQNLSNPYVQRWQLALQRQLGRDIVIEVSYVGNRGTKMRIDKNWDGVPARYLSTSPIRDQQTIDFLAAQVPNPFYPLLPRTSLQSVSVSRSQLLRPYPQFTSVSSTTNQGYIWYHSGQMRFEKRFARDFSSSVSWTWSKAMGATSYLNETDSMPEEVISDEDRTHRLTVVFLWELPFGRGKLLAGSAGRTLNGILGGWQAQGSYTGQSGAAFGFGNAIFYGNLKDIVLPKSQRTVGRWFNVDAGFERDSRKQLGSNIRTLSSRFSGVRGDGQNNWDLAVLKNMKIREQLRLQFRAEFINALNHAQFQSPSGTNPSGSDFGMVTREWAWPRVIQFGLKLLF